MNWKKYNESLVKRGEVLLDFDVIDNWDSQLKKKNQGKEGRKFLYPVPLSDGYMRAYFHFPYRPTEGIVRSHAANTLPSIPDYSRICRRINRLDIKVNDGYKSSLQHDDFFVIAIDSTGFKVTHASEYYTDRAKLRKKYAKLSIGADVLQQIICNIKVRRAPTRHDNIDFKPIVTRISKIKSLSVVVADKAYDSEDNHVLVIGKLHGLSIMPARYEGVPVWKTHGRYRKGMKRGYNKILYNQRNKDETIVSVIKRLFGEHITSRLIRMQNRELTLR